MKCVAPMVALALAAFGIASPARADDVKQACVDAAERGQSLRDTHKLRAARESFVSCARDACPGALKKDCSEWLAAIDKATPTVIFAARQQGQDAVRVGVDVDGTRVQELLDGVAVPMDPGAHTVRFTLAGRPPVDRTVVAREGEKDRVIVVDFEAAGPLATSADPAATSTAVDGTKTGFRVPVAAWVLGGVTVVAGTSFAILGVTGKSQLADLHAGCANTRTGCDQSKIDATHTRLLLADVSLYTGLASLAAAAVVTIIANRRPSAPASAHASPTLAVRF